MPYVRNPIVYPNGKVSENTLQIDTNFAILADAFYNSDPENNPIYKSAYVGASAPLNPKVGQIWMDISVFPPTIYIYDGTNWQTVNKIVLQNNTVLDGDTFIQLMIFLEG
jgi:hypothetical protein